MDHFHAQFHTFVVVKRAGCYQAGGAGADGVWIRNKVSLLHELLSKPFLSIPILHLGFILSV